MLIGFALLACLLAGMESYRGAQMQARRTAEQIDLLEKMKALDKPAVSEVASDWQLAYPEPNEDRLNELRDLATQLQADSDSLGTASRQELSSAPAGRSVSR